MVSGVSGATVAPAPRLVFSIAFNIKKVRSVRWEWQRVANLTLESISFIG